MSDFEGEIGCMPHTTGFCGVTSRFQDDEIQKYLREKIISFRTCVDAPQRFRSTLNKS